MQYRTASYAFVGVGVVVGGWLCYHGYRSWRRQKELGMCELDPQTLMLTLPGDRGNIPVLFMPRNLLHCEKVLQTLTTDLLETDGVVGIDAEWPPGSARTFGVTLMQVATSSQIYCFPLTSKCMLPPTLVKMLESPLLAKAGVGIATDAERLFAGHRCRIKGELELRLLAETCGIPAADKAGLGSLAAELMQVKLDKSLQCSDWGASELSTDQILYGALDAWVSRQLVLSLFSKYCAETSGARPLVHTDALREFFKPCLGLRSVGKSRKKNAGVLDNKPRQGTWSESKSQPCKPKKSKVHIATRKAPLYENCRILAPDGVVLCTCGRKKLKWYLSRNLAVLECEEPPAIRLKFEPNGRGHADDAYYLSDKSNKCCVCGHDGEYLRHSVVPPCYRQHFPEDMKSHLSHDIVLVCVDCKQNANIFDHQRMTELSMKYNAPMEGGGKGQVMRYQVDEHLMMVRSAARAVTHYKASMPEARLKEHYKTLHEYLGKDQISNDDLKTMCALEVKRDVPGFLEHAKTVVTSIKVESPDALESFVRSWRSHFLHNMKPKHLPSHWAVDNRVVNSGKMRTRTPSFPGVVPCIASHELDD